MRLNASNSFIKKNTRNILNYDQMMQLSELGLADIKERNSHRFMGYGVEELLQILPSCIVVEQELYALKIYKTAFDVIAVGYKNPKEGGKYLYCKCCDDIVNEDNPNQSGHLIDVLFDILIFVNSQYPEELEEFKGELNHYVQNL